MMAKILVTGRLAAESSEDPEASAGASVAGSTGAGEASIATGAAVGGFVTTGATVGEFDATTAGSTVIRICCPREQ